MRCIQTTMDDVTTRINYKNILDRGAECHCFLFVPDRYAHKQETRKTEHALDNIMNFNFNMKIRI